jgi:hypothetical protein
MDGAMSTSMLVSPLIIESRAKDGNVELLEM